MQSQARECVGIFGCLEYVPFTDAVTDLPYAVLLPRVVSAPAVPGALTATWVNTEIFIAAWDKIIEDRQYLNHDWTVKVDPDTVFLPARLRKHLDDHRIRKSASGENGVYLRNCQGGPNGLQLFGSLEVLSRRAVSHYAKAGKACRNAPDRGIMGEDMWLQRCLDSIGVGFVADWKVVADGYCPGAPPPGDCTMDRAAFHPFKLTAQWYQCEHASRRAGGVMVTT